MELHTCAAAMGAAVAGAVAVAAAALHGQLADVVVVVVVVVIVVVVATAAAVAGAGAAKCAGDLAAAAAPAELKQAAAGSNDRCLCLRFVFGPKLALAKLPVAPATKHMGAPPPRLVSAGGGWSPLGQLSVLPLELVSVLLLLLLRHFATAGAAISTVVRTVVAPLG